MKIGAKLFFIFLGVLAFVGIVFCSTFFLQFKKENKDVVAKYAEKFNIEKSLIFAVIKAESKFNKNARSGAGAIGLMQVKLSTANYVLSLNDESEITEGELFEADTNIKCGVMYLRYLLDKFENLETSICAYNAGETKIREWLQNPELSTDGKSLKSVPYAETLNYLSKVKFNMRVYKNVLKVWKYGYLCSV